MMDDIDREAVRNIISKFRKEYQTNIEPVIDKILEKINNGQRIYEAVSDSLSETTFFTANRQAVMDAAYLAACAGYGVLPSLLVNPDKIQNKLLNEYWLPDKMPLSERLHGTEGAMRRSLIDTIQRAMTMTKSVKDMAMDLYDGYNSGKVVVSQEKLPSYLNKIRTYARFAVNDKQQIAQPVVDAANELKKKIDGFGSPNVRAAYNGLVQPILDVANANKVLKSSNDMDELRNAYKKLVQACKKLEPKAIDNAVHVALEEKARYHAERIARTESARAWYEGYLAETEDNADIWGYRYCLSSRHGLCPYDQCDVLANADMGYGKGIYPKGKQPSIPRHPHCMCMLQAVYHWEVDKNKSFSPELAREYIDNASEQQRQDLFGDKGAQEYQNGGDWQKLLRGFNGFGDSRVRLSKDDFQELDVEKVMKKNLCPPSDEFIESLAKAQGKSYTKGKGEEERFYSDEGTPIYPPNDGAVGDKSVIVLKAGAELLSRYGPPRGRFLSPDGISFEERALPRGTDKYDFHRYRVLKDIDMVEAATIAAWFGQPGGGIQYKLPVSIKALEQFFEEVKDDDDK